MLYNSGTAAAPALILLQSLTPVTEGVKIFFSPLFFSFFPFFFLFFHEDIFNVVVVSLPGHTHWVLCIAWSPDGKKLASGCKNSQVGLQLVNPP